MSVDAGTEGPAEEVPGDPEGPDLSAACARIARHLARTRCRSIGFLPIDRSSARMARASLAPFLEQLASPLASLVGGDVAFIGPWTEWTADPADAGGSEQVQASGARVRRAQPHVVELIPPPCEDGAAAAAALKRTLGRLPPGVMRVLVDLGARATPTHVPAEINVVDGVVMAVVARHVLRTQITALSAQIPAGRSLGAIVIG